MMKEQKVYTMNVNNFEDHVMTKIAVQSELNSVEQTLTDKIKELEDKLEIVKSRQWKYQVGNKFVLEGSANLFEVTELIDGDKHYLYKAKKVDTYNVFDICNYACHPYEVMITHNEANKSTPIYSINGYAAHLLKTYVEYKKGNEIS